MTSKRIYCLLFFTLLVQGVSAQLTGPSPVTAGQTYTYNYLSSGYLVLPNWQITNGTKVSSTQTGLYYTANINWTTAGNGSVAIYDGNTMKGTLSVSIKPAAPTTVPGNRCGTGSVSLSATPGIGGTAVRWYTALTGGTNFLQGPIWTTPSLSTTTTYYVTSYNSTTGESTPRTPITATINPQLTTAPTVTGNGRFAAGTLILTASGTPSGGSYNWYNTANLIVGTGANYTTAVVSANATNYVYVKATGPGCLSPQTWVSIIIEPLPVVTSTNSRVVMGANVLLDAGAGYSTYNWKDNAGISKAATQTFSTSTPDNYTVTVTKTGITGSGISVPFPVVSQFSGQNMNYVVSNTILADNVVDPNTIENLPVGSNSQTIQFFDGLGRPIQTVATQNSPSKLDLVQPVAYDAYGRESKKYLPFAAQNNSLYKANVLDANGNFANAALNFYNNPNDNIADDSRPFSETEFEQSPLGRPTNDYGPGSDWNNATVKKPVAHAYANNLHGSTAGLEQIFAWKIDATTKLPIRETAVNANVSGGFYLNGQLTIKSTKDEQGNEVR